MDDGRAYGGGDGERRHGLCVTARVKSRKHDATDNIPCLRMRAMREENARVE
jgi:hypothetical protein